MSLEYVSIDRKICNSPSSHRFSTFAHQLHHPRASNRRICLCRGADSSSNARHEEMWREDCLRNQIMARKKTHPAPYAGMHHAVHHTDWRENMFGLIFLPFCRDLVQNRQPMIPARRYAALQHAVDWFV